MFDDAFIGVFYIFAVVIIAFTVIIMYKGHNK